MTLAQRLLNAINAFFENPEIRNSSDSTCSTKEHELAYYSACINGWIQTRLEKDKSILTISSGGIAVIFAVISQSDTHTATTLFLYFLSGVAFAASAVIAVIIFQHNSKILESCLNSGETTAFAWLDRLVALVFSIGVILIVLAGGFQAKFVYEKLSAQENVLSSSEKTVSGASRPRTIAQDSLAGIGRLAPTAKLPPPPSSPPPKKEK